MPEELHTQASEFSFRLKLMVSSAKLNSHNKGRNFKKLTLKVALKEKYIHIFLLKLQIRLS